MTNDFAARNMKTKTILLSLSTVVSLLVTACEPADAIDPFGIVHEKKDDGDKAGSSGQSGGVASQAVASSGTGGVQSQASSSLSGKWSGRSATGQVSSKLSLSESGGSVRGSLSWPGDTRSVSGSRSGSSVTLHIGGGDTWKLTLSGNKLSGTGYKLGGGTYSCSFSRQ